MQSYDKLEYKTLERLVLDYQHGDKDAAMKIINAFRGFMLKFQQVVCSGQINIQDRVTRNFLGLFLYNKKGNVNSYWCQRSTLNDLMSIVGWIREIFSRYDAEEIEQELICALLHMAKRHTPNLEFPSFHVYISKAYHFYAFRQLKALSPFLTQAINDNNAIIDDSAYIDAEKFDEEPIIFDKEIDEEIDENWIAGITCSPSFACLTPFGRKVIKMYYCDELSDEQIGEKLGRSRCVINRKRKAMKEEIMNADKIHQLRRLRYSN